MKQKVDAILWDYDGTLANSVPKNINITKKILHEVAPRLTGNNLPQYLLSSDQYHYANHESKNWQDLYMNYYGLSEIEMIKAGSLWTKYQLEDTTSVELFEGIKDVVNEIMLPQGICSQNSSKNINEVLYKNELSDKFNVIIGYDDIPNDLQKPNAFGGIKCMNSLFENTISKTIFYIGDHEGDVLFARNIQNESKGEVIVYSLIIKFSGANPENWSNHPDFIIEHPSEIIKIIELINSKD